MRILVEQEVVAICKNTGNLCLVVQKQFNSRKTYPFAIDFGDAIQRFRFNRKNLREKNKTEQQAFSDLFEELGEL